MNKKKPRRQKPNLIAQAKIFADHHYLLWARPYEQYEAEKQEYRETGYYVHFDHERNLIRFWPLLDTLIRLPKEPPDSEFKRIAFSDKVCELTARFEVIENQFVVLKRSIDFQTATSKQIDIILANPRKHGLDRNLLSVEQKSIFRSLAFDVDLWAQHDQSETDQTPNLVKICLSVQDEIDTNGTVTDEGRRKLEYLRTLLAGTRRQRLYAESALVMMLAELYERENSFDRKAVMKRDPAQPSKDWHESIADEDKYRDDQGDIIPWSPKYISPFSYFLAAFLSVFDLDGISTANAAEITKNRKKLKSKKVLHLCDLRNGYDDLTKLFQILDRVKP